VAASEVVIRAAPGGGALDGAGGYFLDHGSYTNKPRGVPNTPWWDANATYTAKMKYIFSMQNLTFGPSGGGGLMQACGVRYTAEPWLCFMAPHMQSFITTPIFLFNSKYDAWQLDNILQTGGLTNATNAWNSVLVRRAVLEYGDDFLAALAPFWGRETNTTHGHVRQPAPKNGGFVTSCICHECRWNDPNLMIDGKSAIGHYASWFFGKTVGASAMHIDHRTPNGGGMFNSSIICLENGYPSALRPCCLPFEPLQTHASL
jgi:hypothetical protein